jgi:hypothetical protein
LERFDFGTLSNDFDSLGNFEVQQCRILDPMLFAMRLDEMGAIIGDPENPVGKPGVPIRSNDELFDITEYNYAGFPTPCYFPRFLMRTTSSL